MANPKAETPKDLSQFRVVERSEAGGDLELIGPYDNEPIGTTLRVLGYDSDAVTMAARAFDRELAAKDPKEVNQLDAFRDRQLALAKAAVVGWDVMIENGDEVAFSPEARDRILDDRNYQLWMVKQITEFGRDRANFRPRPEVD